MAKYQRDKGANFEREVANMFKEEGINARRGIRQWQDAKGEPDVVIEDFPGLWVEAKKGAKTYPIKALEQAREACDSHGIPLAICKDDYGKTTVTMDWSFFVLLLRDFINSPMASKPNTSNKLPSALNMDSGSGSLSNPSNPSNQSQVDWVNAIKKPA